MPVVLSGTPLRQQQTLTAAHRQLGCLRLEPNMSKRLLASAVAIFAGVFSLNAAFAQPAPPPPPGFPDYVHVLDDAYNARNIPAYGDLFREDVRVFVDGSLVASGRASYLQRAQSEFRRNLHVSTFSWAQGSQILAMQAVSGCIPVRPDPNTVYHGCHWVIAVRYDLSDDHKIASVHILEAERAWNMHPTSD